MSWSRTMSGPWSTEVCCAMLCQIVRIAHSESTHATMARCLRCDMDEFGSMQCPLLPQHQGNKSSRMQGEQGHVGDLSSPRTPTAPQTVELMPWGREWNTQNSGHEMKQRRRRRKGAKDGRIFKSTKWSTGRASREKRDIFASIVDHFRSTFGPKLGSKMDSRLIQNRSKISVQKGGRAAAAA